MEPKKVELTKELICSIINEYIIMKHQFLTISKEEIIDHIFKCLNEIENK